ncbi:PilZ domain-containing protein [Bdellovibrio sp. HCB2-146]|uniref:PilZ domain-containing protein n=1 Tax=Bdellovibrio sp. HCB2-146 TaxID=3394362 RepID=UPI0039BCA0E6
MQLTAGKDLIYLSSSQSLPSYLGNISGVRWHHMKSTEELKAFLQGRTGDVTVVVKTDQLNSRTIQAFLSWTQMKFRWSFIFIAQTIEKAAYQLTNMGHPILLIRESEGARITDIITRRILGGIVKSRRQERLHVASPVMIKKSAFMKNSPTGAAVQLLREGSMVDFSQGGAQVTVHQNGVKVKDFVSLMYRDKKGLWVSVESQVRWVRSLSEGIQVVGVQFLAVST